MKNILFILLMTTLYFNTGCFRQKQKAIVSNNNHKKKQVALTFDDGPDSSYTDKIMDILKKENVKATFFVIGDKVKKHPEIVKRMDEEGHFVENHSKTHRHFTEYKDNDLVLKDVRYVDSLVFAIIGKKAKYFRPPFGSLRSEQKTFLNKHGYKIALWTLSPRDWNVFKVKASDILDTVKTYIHNNAVILMHSKDASGSLEKYPYRDNTIEALPKVIKFLREKGYQFVTFDKIKPRYDIGGDVKSMEASLKKRDDIIFYGGFEEEYNNVFWSKKWGINWTSRIDESKIVNSDFIGKKVLRVSYPKGGLGPSTTGLQFPVVFDDIESLKRGFYQEAYLRYYVKFEKGFDFRRGGKLPGLMGGGDSWNRSGGNQPVGDNGWTLRFMWVENGRIVVYAYVPKSKNGKWGESLWGQGIDCGFNAVPGKWHCIEQYVNVGTPGKDNGKLKVWIDGVERVNIDDMRFWNVENNMGRIGGFYFSTFHGGNTDDWRPLNDSYMQFDGFVVGKSRIGMAKLK